MFRQRLALASALCVVACAQIAGFEQLSSPEPDEVAGGGTAGAAAGGPSPGEGGAVASGGHVASSAGAGASAGALSNAGKGGGIASGGNAPSAGATSILAGAAGTMAGAAGTTAGTAGAGGAAGAPVTGGCNAQLLKNSDFEAGGLSWQLESTLPGISELPDVILRSDHPALAMANITPRPGNYLARLGGSQDADKSSHVSLTQSVQIPAKVSRLVLSGWIQIKTTEPDPEETTDQLDFTLQDELMYWSFHFWKGTDVTSGWQSFSYEFADAARLNALRGRTLTFYAEARADQTELTSYWLDSLSLFAQCP